MSKALDMVDNDKLLTEAGKWNTLRVLESKGRMCNVKPLMRLSLRTQRS